MPWGFHRARTREPVSAAYVHTADPCERCTCTQVSVYVACEYMRDMCREIRINTGVRDRQVSVCAQKELAHRYIHLSIYRSIDLSIYLSIDLSIYLSIQTRPAATIYLSETTRGRTSLVSRC